MNDQIASPTADLTEIPPDLSGQNFATHATSTKPGMDTMPESIKELLSHPPLLDHENESDFLEMFEGYREYAKPENIIDYDLVWTLAVSKWEIKRYRFMTTAATSNQQFPAMKTLLMQIHPSASHPLKYSKAAVEIDADRDARKCFADEVYKEEMYCKLEMMTFIPDGQAFLMSLPALATIERLLASAEKRYAAALKELEKRIANRV